MRRWFVRAQLRRASSRVVTIVALAAAFIAVVGAGTPAAAKSFEISAGVKAGAGVELWTAPTGTSTSYLDGSGNAQQFHMPFFDETRSGYNYAVGMYLEMRFWNYFGIEVGAFISRHTLHEDTDWSYTETDLGSGQQTMYTTKTEQELVFTAFRIPVIFKGILPVGDAVRLSLGVGPEFAIGSYAYATFKKTGGDPLYGARAAFNELDAVEQTDIYLVSVLGIDVNAGKFRIPIDIRFGYNFNQPGGYYDRITYDNLPTTGAPTAYPTKGTFKARDSMYFQILVGLGFDY